MASSVLVIAAYFIIWALIHSLLASTAVKRWVRRTLGDRATRGYRLAFCALAAITVLPMPTMVALLPDRPLYVVPSPWRWAMMGGQLLAIATMAWTLLQTGPLHFFGLAQLFATGPVSSGPLQVRGLYCYVRHPLYLFGLFTIWLTPVMTVNLLTLYALITLYLSVGSLHEEERMVAEYGATYRDYQWRVPRFIPRLRRCYPPGEAGAQEGGPA